MNTSLVATILFLVCITDTSAIRYKDCGSKGSAVQSVLVSGCKTKPTCPLPRGQNSTITVVFKTSKGFSKATADVHGILAGIPVSFPIPNPNGCKDCGLTCPVKKDTVNTYTTNIFVKKAYPEVRVVVKWELKDENGEDIFCIEVPAEVSDAAHTVNQMN